MLTLTDIGRDALGQVINVAIARATAALNEMIGIHDVGLLMPYLDVCVRAEAVRRLGGAMGDGGAIAVRQAFAGQIDGEMMLILPETGSLELVRLFLADTAPVTAMTDLEQKALVEVGNILLNACIGGLASICRQPVQSGLPVLLHGPAAAGLTTDPHPNRRDADDDSVLFVPIDFAVSGCAVQGYLTCLMDGRSEQIFRRRLDDYVRGGAEK